MPDTLRDSKYTVMARASRVEYHRDDPRRVELG